MNNICVIATVVLQIYNVNIIVVFSTGGCAMFGHSCYGAHGKRSFQMHMQQPARDWPATSEEETAQIDDAIDKYFEMKPSSSPHFTPFWQKIVSFRIPMMMGILFSTVKVPI